MTAITETTLETIASTIETGNTRTNSIMHLMLLSALGEHALSWLDHAARFVVGGLLAWAILALAQWPGLSFLAAYSAGAGLLYLASTADVERYRDGILLLVPTLFVWVMLSLASANAAVVGLTLFTHVFLGFVGAFARITGGLHVMRLWSLLLGFHLVMLVYLVSVFLL